MAENRSPALTDEEWQWLRLFNRVDFPCPWKKQIQEQIAMANISREYYQNALFLDFNVPPALRTLPHFSNRVPIEFLVQHIFSGRTEVGLITYDNIRSMKIERDGEDGPYPTSFMLHIFRGSVQELEIYNLDSSIIDRKTICEGRCDYWISPDFAGMIP